MNLPFTAFKGILLKYVSDKTIDEMIYKWNEKHRFYHDINHLISVLKEIENSIYFKDLNINEKHSLLLAAFFHDIVYNPKKKDNEDQSIQIFLRSFNNKDPKMRDKVCKLIEITKYRKRPSDKLERMFWDADNAGFKKGYNEILKNEKLIRREYSFLDSKKYKEKRIAFLESNLGLFNNSVDKDIKKLIEYIKKEY